MEAATNSATGWLGNIPRTDSVINHPLPTHLHLSSLSLSLSVFLCFPLSRSVFLSLSLCLCLSLSSLTPYPLNPSSLFVLTWARSINLRNYSRTSWTQSAVRLPNVVLCRLGNGAIRFGARQVFTAHGLCGDAWPKGPFQPFQWWTPLGRNKAPDCTVVVSRALCSRDSSVRRAWRGIAKSWRTLGHFVIGIATGKGRRWGGGGGGVVVEGGLFYFGV